jgi:hypothetical protein
MEKTVPPAQGLSLISEGMLVRNVIKWRASPFPFPTTRGERKPKQAPHLPEQSQLNITVRAGAVAQ